MIKILQINEIVEGKKPLPKPVKEFPYNGVYFLIKDNEVVYVGKSKDVHSRVMTHLVDKEKDFDSYSYILLENAHDRDVTECFYIETLAPKYNNSFSEKHLLLEVLQEIALLSGYKIRSREEIFKKQDENNLRN